MPSKTKRSQTLDAAKGFAIIGIVAGHVWRGLASADLISENSALFQAVDRSLYKFYLAVFAFTAGLFVQRGINRSGAWNYVRSRDAEFLWLYVAWSTIQVAIKLGMSGTVNEPVKPMDLMTLWEPKEQFWFFPWIALMMVLAAAFQPWKSRVRAATGSILVSFLSLSMWGLGGDLIGTQGLGLVAFFWVALLIGGTRTVEYLDGLSWRCQLVGGLISGTAMVLLAVTTPAVPPTEDIGRSVAGVGLGVLASVLGVFATLSICAFMARSEAAVKPLSSIGRLSLVVFVAHVFFTAATRMVLLKLGIDSVLVQMVFGCFAGIAGPLTMRAICVRIGLGRLFAAPKRLTYVESRLPV